MEVFLICAEQEADGVGAWHVEPAQALHRMKGNHRRALVVQATTAHEVAILFRHLEGLESPTRAGGHDVHVPDDAKLRLGLAGQIRKADVALAVGGGHAHTLGDLERRFQGGSGARAIGCTRCSSGQVLGRGNFHELGDVSHNSIAMSIPVCLGGGNYFLAVHRRSFQAYRPLKCGTPYHGTSALFRQKRYSTHLAPARPRQLSMPLWPFPKSSTGHFSICCGAVRRLATCLIFPVDMLIMGSVYAQRERTHRHGRRFHHFGTC